jgi:hypothetical protein
MAGKIVSRDTTYLILSGIMAIGLAVAIAGGLVAIVRFGQPDGATATLIAEIFAWLFAAALLTAFFMAVSDELSARQAKH